MEEKTLLWYIAVIVTFTFILTLVLGAMTFGKMVRSQGDIIDQQQTSKQMQGAKSSESPEIDACIKQCITEGGIPEQCLQKCKSQETN